MNNHFIEQNNPKGGISHENDRNNITDKPWKIRNGFPRPELQDQKDVSPSRLFQLAEDGPLCSGCHADSSGSGEY